MKKPFTWAAVSSSIIKEVAHNAEDEILWVKFHNESIYKYFGVNEASFKALMRAESVGKHFKLNIEKNHVFVKV
jgi:hypothetical protein